MAKSCIYYLASESIWSCKKKSLWQSSTPFFKTLGTLTYPWNVVRKPRLFLDCLSELREVPKDSREWSALGYSQGCSGEPPTIKAKDQGCHKTPFYRNTALKGSWAYTVSEDRPHLSSCRADPEGILQALDQSTASNALQFSSFHRSDFFPDATQDVGNCYCWFPIL